MDLPRNRKKRKREKTMNKIEIYGYISIIMYFLLTTWIFGYQYALFGIIAYFYLRICENSIFFKKLTKHNEVKKI